MVVGGFLSFISGNTIIPFDPTILSAFRYCLPSGVPNFVID